MKRKIKKALQASETLTPLERLVLRKIKRKEFVLSCAINFMIACEVLAVLAIFILR